MSRSVRKTPISTHYGVRNTEKWSKQEWHRKMRSKSKIILRHTEADSVLLPHMREVSNVWAMAKDGKMRFDPVEWPKGMRK